LDAGGVEFSSDDVIFDSGQIFDSAASNQDNGVFGEIVTDTWDICGDLDFVREADTGDFSKCRVGFFGSHGFYHGANPALERGRQRGSTTGTGIEKFPKRGGLDFFGGFFSSFTDELVGGWHGKRSRMKNKRSNRILKPNI
jgi:hypothetical protein